MHLMVDRLEPRTGDRGAGTGSQMPLPGLRKTFKPAVTPIRRSCFTPSLRASLRNEMPSPECRQHPL